MQEWSLAHQQIVPEEGAIPTSSRDIVQIFFRNRWKFVVATAFAFILVLLWVFATPKKYTSEMVLLVQNARTNEVISPENNVLPGGASIITDEQLNSELSVLNSTDLLDEVASPGWKQKIASAPPTTSEVQEHDAAVGNIKKRLDISVVRSSHVISAKFVGKTPEASRDVLSRLLTVFLAKQTELGRPPGSSKFFDEQVTQYAHDLADARMKLAQYQQEHGFVSLSDNETDIAKKLGELQVLFRDNEVQISDTSNRISVDKATLANTPARLSTAERTGPSAGTVDQLNALLVNLTNQRTKLLTEYKPTDRLVQEVDKEIADTTEGLNRAARFDTRETATDVNPLWQQTERELTSNQSKLQGLRAAHAQMQSQIQGMQKDLNSKESQSEEFNTLQQKVSELEGSYRLVLQKRDASELSDRMDQQQWLNVAVIEAPTFSLSPTHPQPPRDLLLGGITSVLFGLLVIFFAETTRGTMATPVEMGKLSKFPVLATVPFQRDPVFANSTAQPYLYSESGSGH